VITLRLKILAKSVRIEFKSPQDLDNTVRKRLMALLNKEIQLGISRIELAARRLLSIQMEVQVLTTKTETSALTLRAFL